MNTRDFNYDFLKFVLIILVIYAHIPLIHGLLNYGIMSLNIDESVWFLTKGIYAFHMPLFVLISGLFTKKRNLHDTIKYSSKFIYIFIFFHIINLLLVYLIDDKFSFNAIITPSFALWYLFCLFLWRVLVSLIPSTIDKRIIIFLSICISIFIGFIPFSGLFGLHRFFSFIPFFCIGFYCKEYIFRAIKFIMYESRYKNIYAVFSIILFIIFFVIATHNEYWLRIMISPYTKWSDFIFRLLYLLNSFILGLTFIILIFSINRNKANIFSIMGAKSLFYYVYHPYLLYIYVYIINNHIYTNINIYSSILITLFTFLSLFLLYKISILHKILE